MDADDLEAYKDRTNSVPKILVGGDFITGREDVQPLPASPWGEAEARMGAMETGQEHLTQGSLHTIAEGFGQELKKPIIRSKYDRPVPKKTHMDVYDVLEAFDVQCPALQHLIKKALCAGLRGHKEAMEDLIDIEDSAHRAVELQEARQEE